MLSQNPVTAYFSSKQLLGFFFARQNSSFSSSVSLSFELQYIRCFCWMYIDCCQWQCDEVRSRGLTPTWPTYGLYMLMGLVQHLDVPWLLDVNRGEQFTRTATRLTVARQPLVLLLPWLLLYTDCYEQRWRLYYGLCWLVRTYVYAPFWLDSREDII